MVEVCRLTQARSHVAMLRGFAYTCVHQEEMRALTAEYVLQQAFSNLFIYYVFIFKLVMTLIKPKATESHRLAEAS